MWMRSSADEPPGEELCTPRWGHNPFDEISETLADVSYDGSITAEILPNPDADSAVRQAGRFLRAGLARAFQRGGRPIGRLKREVTHA
jgi:sugar phosphate isomerase/epimerase